MGREWQIPVLNSENMHEFHFGDISRNMPFSNVSTTFHINRLEEFRTYLHFPLPPHRKQVHDLILIIQGSSIRAKGLNEFDFGKDEAFVLPAFQITKHEWMSEDIKGYYVHFDPQILKAIGTEGQLKKIPMLDFLSNPIVQIPDKEMPHIISLFERLYSLYDTDKPMEIELVGFYLMTILMEFSLFAPEKNQVISPAENLLKNYKERLSELIYQNQKVSEYAEILHVSPNHLNKCVKKLTGNSAQQLLNEMLVMEAKSLLKFSNLQISEISDKLMDQSPSNFIRFFKNQTGLTPKEYKNIA